MKNIHLSKALSFPLDIVTQVIAILAKRRAGKSYTARKLVEQLLACDQQVVSVDPKGDQWGIRSSADGKHPGFPIVILGGEHGDAPLEVNSGELVAKLVVEERVSVLLDLSSFRKYEVASFMAIFMENFYRLKAQEKYRTPVMLVVDEADAIAPQRPQKGEERMLGAIEDIVRRGGQRGIGCTLVTQRSAVLNKNVLTQAQVMVALRTIAPQDLAAMNAWIDVHGTPEERKVLMESLPSLPIGDAWVWSPGWPTADGIFKRVHVAPIETFDSAATPKPGEKKVVPRNLADVDLDSLRKQMSDVMEKAKQDDPKELKKRIKELEGEVKGRGTELQITKGAASQEQVDKAIKYALEKAEKIHVTEIERTKALFAKEVNRLREIMGKIAKLIGTPDIIKVDLSDFKIDPSLIKPGSITRVSPQEITVKKESVEPHFERPAPLVDPDIQDQKLSLCSRSIYSFLFANPGRKFSKVQIAAVTGYSVNSGGFKNSLSELNARGLIVRHGDLLALLNRDESLVDESAAEGYNPEIWFSKLSKCENEIFRVLWDNPSSSFGKDELASRTPSNYSPTSGGYKNALSHLSSLGLMVRAGGEVKLNEELLNI